MYSNRAVFCPCCFQPKLDCRAWLSGPSISWLHSSQAAVRVGGSGAIRAAERYLRPRLSAVGGLSGRNSSHANGGECSQSVLVSLSWHNVTSIGATVSPPCGRALHNPHHGHAAADRSAAPPGAAGGAAGVTGSNPSASRGPHTHQRGDWDVHGQRGVLGAGCHLLDAWGCPAYDGPAHQSRTYSRPLARDVLPARMLADHARYFSQHLRALRGRRRSSSQRQRGALRSFFRLRAGGFRSVLQRADAADAAQQTGVVAAPAGVALRNYAGVHGRADALSMEKSRVAAAPLVRTVLRHRIQPLRRTLGG
jgi:hypothetical protein